MPTMQEIVSDPNFLALPMNERVRALRMIDPNFAALPEKEQGRAIFMLRQPDTLAKVPDVAGAKEEQGFFRRNVVPGILPTVGSVVGAAGGGLLAGPSVLGVPAGVLAGEAAGGAAGEGSNQLLGITEPSATEVGKAALAPGVGRAVLGPLVKFGSRLIPGSQAAKRELATETIDRFVNKVRPGQAAGPLYKAAEAEGLSVAPKNLLSTIEGGSEVLTGIEQGLKAAQPAGLMSAVKELKDMAAKGDVSFLELTAKYKSLRPLLQTQELRGNKQAFAAITDLRQAILKDISESSVAAGSPAAELFAQARLTAQKSIAADHLDDLLTKAVTEQEGTGVKSMRFAAFSKTINNDKLLQRALDPSELKEIGGLLDRFKRLPILPPPPGVKFGSGTNVLLGGAGFIGDIATGGTPGVLASVVPLANFLVSKMAVSDPGRKMLKQVFDSGALDFPRLAAMMAFVRAQTGENLPPINSPGSPATQ